MVRNLRTNTRRTRCKRVPMPQSIGTQTSPEKFIPNHWNPRVLIKQLTMAQVCETPSNVTNMERNVDPVISQYNDLPKISRLPNNYNVFVRPITNNERANSTLASGFLSNSESQKSLLGSEKQPSTCTQENRVTKRYKPGPKCYKRLHEEFHEEFDIPLLRNDDNNNNSLNNSLTVIHEQEEDISQPPDEMILTNCRNDNEVLPVLDVSSGACDISEPTGLAGLIELLDNPSDVILDSINQDMTRTNSQANVPITKDPGNNKEPENEPTENVGDQKRRRNKTVTFEFRDIRTEIVENGENEQTAPNEENDSMEDEDDVGAHLRKRKYIRIFAEKVNIYNHFYN